MQSGISVALFPLRGARDDFEMDPSFNRDGQTGNASSQRKTSHSERENLEEKLCAGVWGVLSH